MPALANQILSLSNTAFSTAYLYGTPNNETGFTDDLLFGQLQEVTIDFKTPIKKLMGPSSLTPLAAAADSREITVKAKFAQIRARSLMNLLGGTATFASNVTTMSITGGNGASGPVDTGPSWIQMHVKTPLDGSDIEIKIYAAICDQLSLPVRLRDFVLPDFSATVYIDGSNKIIDILLPGNQTTS